MAVAHKTRHEVHSEASRRDILDASIRLLAESGLKSLTTRRIAAEAGISASMIFFHYGNREGLLAATVRELFERGARDLNPLLEDASLDSLAKTRRILEVMAGWVRQQDSPLLAGNVLAIEAATDGWRTESWRASALWRDRIAAPLEEAIKEGKLRRVNVRLFIEFYMDALRGALLRAQAIHCPVPEPVIAYIHRVALEHLGL